MSAAAFEKCFPLLDCHRKHQNLVALCQKIKRISETAESDHVAFPKKLIDDLLEAGETCNISTLRAMSTVVDLQVIQRQQLQEQSWAQNSINCKAHQMEFEVQACKDNGSHSKKMKKATHTDARSLNADQHTVQFKDVPLNTYPFLKQLMPSFSVM